MDWSVIEPRPPQCWRLELICILYTQIQFLPHNEQNEISIKNTSQWTPCKLKIVSVWESCVSQHIVWAKMQCCSVKSLYIFKYTNSLLWNIASISAFSLPYHKRYNRFAVPVTSYASVLTRIMGSHKLASMCSWNAMRSGFMLIDFLWARSWIGSTICPE